MPPADRPHRRLSAALAGLHRALLNAQAQGRPEAGNPYALLQALMHDPDFAWLRAYSDLMLRIDEAGAKGATPPPEAMAGFVADAGALIDSDAGTPIDSDAVALIDADTGAPAEGEDGPRARLQAMQARPEVASRTAELREVVSALRRELAQ